MTNKPIFGIDKVYLGIDNELRDREKDFNSAQASTCMQKIPKWVFVMSYDIGSHV